MDSLDITKLWTLVTSLKPDPIASPTALKSDSSMVRQSYRQHEYDMRGISTVLLFSFKLSEETKYCTKWLNKLRIYFIFIFPQFYEKVSDYRAVGLLSRRTIDTHPFKTAWILLIDSRNAYISNWTVFMQQLNILILNIFQNVKFKNKVMS